MFSTLMNEYVNIFGDFSTRYFKGWLLLNSSVHHFLQKEKATSNCTHMGPEDPLNRKKDPQNPF